MSKLTDTSKFAKLCLLIGRLQEAKEQKAFTGSEHYERRKKTLNNAIDRLTEESSLGTASRLLEREEELLSELEDLGIRLGRKYSRNFDHIHETSVKKELITELVEEDEDIEVLASLLFGKDFVTETPKIKQYLRSTIRGWIG